MQILQIIPAHGVVARFKDGSWPVVCWALIADLSDTGVPYQDVFGMIIEEGATVLVDVHINGGFEGYEYTSS
jgi:hypothetical protein